MLRAIIADDEPAVGKLIRHFFEKEQIPVQIIDEVNDGQAALDAILTQRPDLVFLDIQMPGMTGVELAKRIKKISFIMSRFVVLLAASHGVVKSSF